MDVKFWGPSGWELLHLITVTIGGLEEKKELFSTLDHILPCKYCRQSAEEFLKEDPPQNNIAFWLYKFHDKVNEKLHKQHLEDSKIPDSEESPDFDIVLKRYQKILKERTIKYPGRDFLLSIALNFNKKGSNEHTKFWNALIKLYPYYELRKKLFIPDFNNYFKDVQKMFEDMGSSVKKEDISKHRGSCKKGGATCRSLKTISKTKK
jgi:hypothetical protein